MIDLIDIITKNIIIILTKILKIIKNNYWKVYFLSIIKIKVIILKKVFKKIKHYKKILNI